MDGARAPVLRVGPSVSGPTSRTQRRARLAAGVLGLVAVAALAFFLDLGRPDFWDPGESRYAETVREMMLTGNWLEPTLAFVPYYDKPPGFFWLVAAAFGAFGASEWAARLPSALAAVVTIAMVVAFAWPRVGARAALAAGVILATAIQFVALGRSVRMDTLLTLLTTAPLLCFYLLVEPGGRWRATWPLWTLPAAGLLVKGPVAAVLPVLVAATYAGVTRTRCRLRQLAPGGATLAALAVLGGWYVVEALRAPDYLWTFLWQHNLGRFAGRALAGHREPLWFYLWILPLTFLPWSLFLPGALARAWRRARRHDRLTIFLLAWCAVPFVLFSLSRAKLATYLLPIFPPLAILVAVYLDRLVRAPRPLARQALRVPGTVWVAVLAALVVGGPIALVATHPAHGREALALLALAPLPLLGWTLLRRDRWKAVPALVAGGALAIQVLFYRVGAPVVDEFLSLRGAAEIARDLPAEATVYAYKTRGHSFTYYGGRILSRVRSPEAVAEVLGRSVPTAVLVKARHLEKIRRHLGDPVCIWWRGPSGRLLLANLPRRDAPGGQALEPATAATVAVGSRTPPRC